MIINQEIYQPIGLNEIMKKIRPFVKFRLENTVFTKWDDPTGSTPPTWEEINKQIEKDKEQWHILQK
jgi:hypothetical protein